MKSKHLNTILRCKEKEANAKILLAIAAVITAVTGFLVGILHGF